MYLGSRTVREQDASYFQDLRIVTVIDASGMPDLPQHPGITYHTITVDDKESSTIKPFFQETQRMIMESHAQGASAFVHCNQGISRSATLVMAFLVQQRKMTLKETWSLMKAKRSVVMPNVGFWKELLELEIQVHGQPSLTIGKYGQLLWNKQNN
uniref:Protein-tyrosine-phosphatase n=1 Tax=Arcella intermedia TaxID=1963864 RepID=A0A6B2LNL4_9EUKA